MLSEFRQRAGCLSEDPPQNAWICKPAGKSRGRGIFITHSLDEIFSLPTGSSDENLPAEDAIDRDDDYVVQKYIERPLIFRGVKFDIRCWVLVSQVSPALTVWMWTEPYLRLASHAYSKDVKDVFAHLTNNSIQKYGADYDGNMWGFTDYCESVLGPELEKGEGSTKKPQTDLKNFFLKQMSAIVVASI